MWIEPGISHFGRGRSALVAAALVGLLIAGSERQVIAQDTAVDGTPAPETETRVDPFSPETIFERTAEPTTSARKRFVPAAARPARLPELTLRGIGRTKGADSPTVLLEIEGHGMFIVREGDTISLQDLPAENVIRIREITEISVIVETGSFGELIILR